MAGYETDAYLALREGPENGQEHIALALHEVARAIRDMTYKLGVRDAATNMGALEALGQQVERVADAIHEGAVNIEQIAMDYRASQMEGK